MIEEIDQPYLEQYLSISSRKGVGSGTEVSTTSWPGGISLRGLPIGRPVGFVMLAVLHAVQARSTRILAKTK